MSLTRAMKIDEEASILSRVYSDLDNYRRFYSMQEVHQDETIRVQFVAPKLFLFEEFRFVLLQNSVIKPLQPERYFRPDYVSFDEYGTTNLWAMLLFINDIPAIEDFKVDNIKIPSKRSVMMLTNASGGRKTLEEIVALHELPSDPTPPLFLKQKVTPKEQDQKSSILDASLAAGDAYFKRETFTLDIVDVRNRYVDLKFEPVEESIFLRIVDHPNYIKGKHYDMIRGSKGKNRLTWDSRRIFQGAGLVSTMIEGVQFEISYAQRIRL